MSDPAVVAAQRAWDALPEQSYATREQVMEAAAREALKPIRAWMERIAAYEAGADIECPSLSDLTPLVYPTEELER